MKTFAAFLVLLLALAGCSGSGSGGSDSGSPGSSGLGSSGPAYSTAYSTKALIVGGTFEATDGNGNDVTARLALRASGKQNGSTTFNATEARAILNSSKKPIRVIHKGGSGALLNNGENTPFNGQLAGYILEAGQNGPDLQLNFASTLLVALTDAAFTANSLSVQDAYAMQATVAEIINSAAGGLGQAGGAMLRPYDMFFGNPMDTEQRMLAAFAVLMGGDSLSAGDAGATELRGFESALSVADLISGNNLNQDFADILEEAKQGSLLSIPDLVGKTFQNAALQDAFAAVLDGNMSKMRDAGLKRRDGNNAVPDENEIISLANQHSWNGSHYLVLIGDDENSLVSSASTTAFYATSGFSIGDHGEIWIDIWITKKVYILARPITFPAEKIGDMNGKPLSAWLAAGAVAPAYFSVEKNGVMVKTTDINDFLLSPYSYVHDGNFNFVSDINLDAFAGSALNYAGEIPHVDFRINPSKLGGPTDIDIFLRFNPTPSIGFDRPCVVGFHN